MLNVKKIPVSTKTAQDTEYLRLRTRNKGQINILHNGAQSETKAFPSVGLLTVTFAIAVALLDARSLMWPLTCDGISAFSATAFIC